MSNGSDEKAIPLSKDNTRVSIFYQERLRQAKLSFNFTIIIMIIQIVVASSGSLMIVSGNVQGGSAAMSTALFFENIRKKWIQSAKDANDRLDKTTES
ncbi:MAG: hypothetical protein VKJ02_00805 [Snowella sp.]|nr:hypothetical protein [Snowella sp.]